MKKKKKKKMMYRHVMEHVTVFDDKVVNIALRNVFFF